jgi:hypothetical protein
MWHKLWLCNGRDAIHKLRFLCYHLVGRSGGVWWSRKEYVRTNSLALRQSRPFGLRAGMDVDHDEILSPLMLDGRQHKVISPAMWVGTCLC